jgi:cysteinyl-tRNA synthetase
MALLGRLDGVTRPGAHPDVAEKVKVAREAFGAALRDDLNTAGALGTMFELVTVLNSAIDAGEFGEDDVVVVRGAFDEFDRVLGVLSLRRAEEEQPPVPVAEIERLIEERHAAKKRRDFAAADKIRKDLADLGIVLEDTPGGT